MLLKKLVLSMSVSDNGLNSRYSHHLDARARARTHANNLVLQGQRQPCCSLLHYYLQPQIRWEPGLQRPQTGGQRPHCPASRPRKGQKTADSSRLGSVSGCLLLPPAPPPPEQPSAGERQSQNERSVWVVYLQPDEPARTGVHV